MDCQMLSEVKVSRLGEGMLQSPLGKDDDTDHT